MLVEQTHTSSIRFHVFATRTRDGRDVARAEPISRVWPSVFPTSKQQLFLKPFLRLYFCFYVCFPHISIPLDTAVAATLVAAAVASYAHPYPSGDIFTVFVRICGESLFEVKRLKQKIFLDYFLNHYFAST